MLSFNMSLFDSTLKILKLQKVLMFGLPRKYFKFFFLSPKYVKLLQNNFEQNIWV
jgi:hypothetical protein